MCFIQPFQHATFHELWRQKKKISSPSVPTWALEKGKCHTGIRGCMSLFIKILTHNRRHYSSGSGWDNLLHVPILWPSVIEYRTTVQCMYPFIKEQTTSMNDFFFFLSFFLSSSFLFFFFFGGGEEHLSYVCALAWTTTGCSEWHCLW